MMAAVMDAGDPERTRGSSRVKEPSGRQEEILVTYVENPNAAAVGRALRTNERHVRRILKQFPDRLDDLRRQFDEERLEKARARQARTQDWADARLDADLQRLDELAGSSNEGVALRAIKMKLDLALRAPSPRSIPGVSDLDRSLLGVERGLVRRIDQVRWAALDEEGTDDA